MSGKLWRFHVAILFCTILPTYGNASVFNRQPHFIINAEKSKTFDNSCFVEEFNITHGKISECLEHCLRNCLCQSFQICQSTTCQLCSTNKKETSSLLRDNENCTYAMYEKPHVPQKMSDQCSVGMSCPMNYNCCKQKPALCPQHKICKPISSLAEPWKRFTCECPDGYRGDKCNEPIRSCRGYKRQDSQESGYYKIVGSNDLMFEVYCHFDSLGTWTLVQSYSYANREDFKKALFVDSPIGKDTPTWTRYRLSKDRMQTIQNRSALLRFTCAFEQYYDVEKSDYLQVSFEDLKHDVFELNAVKKTSYSSIRHGKIRGSSLANCQVALHQCDYSTVKLSMHAHIKDNTACTFHLPVKGCDWDYNYFGEHSHTWACKDSEYRCTNSAESTTQIWFGY